AGHPAGHRPAAAAAGGGKRPRARLRLPSPAPPGRCQPGTDPPVGTPRAGFHPHPSGQVPRPAGIAGRGDRAVNARAPLWACLHLRAPALAAGRRRLAEPPGLLAICDGPQTRPFVLACSAAAAMAGVRPGQSLPAARALCPALRVLPRDPAAERELRELLGQWAYGYSDQVSPDLPDAVALEVGGSLTLCRGWPRLGRCLRDDLALLGLEAG